MKKSRRLLHITNRSRDAFAGFMFFLPWLTGFITITAYPLVYSLVISINQVVIKPGSIKLDPVGFTYYKQAFAADKEFPGLLVSSLTNVLMGTVLAVVFALIIALLLNHKFRGRALFRMIFFLPVIIMSGPVISELLTQTSAMTIDINVFNIMSLLQAMDSDLARALITFLNSFIQILWFSGVQTIIFLAALQKIDRSMYEAAKVDGASGWESFWCITLPFMRPVILLNTIYSIIEIGTFAGDATNRKIINDMKDIARPYSYSAAMSWIYAFCLLAIILLAALLLKERKKTGRV